MSAQHAAPSPARRRSVLLLAGATVLGLWFGLRAPDVSPVAAPNPAVQAPPAQVTTVDPVVPPPDGRAPGRGGRR